MSAEVGAVDIWHLWVSAGSQRLMRHEETHRVSSQWDCQEEINGKHHGVDSNCESSFISLPGSVLSPCSLTIIQYTLHVWSRLFLACLSKRPQFEVIALLLHLVYTTQRCIYPQLRCKDLHFNKDIQMWDENAGKGLKVSLTPDVLLIESGSLLARTFCCHL